MIFSRSFAARLPMEHCKPKFLEEKAIEFLENVKDEPFIFMLVSWSPIRLSLDHWTVFILQHEVFFREILTMN